jgi:hypothetical protein
MLFHLLKTKSIFCQPWEDNFMSNTQRDAETNRRTLIAAVAAAGAAVPLMTASAKAASGTDDDQRCGSTGLKPGPRFVVDIGGVDIPPDMAEVLGAQIRKMVLMTLARSGMKVPVYEGGLPP